ncbi:hypothetical protein [Streptomyces decoyicus]|uniref:hypothetical protein n=1 Tax=Streptomyces decoyicus TaxID=249567 RepID=UPI002E2EFFAB|nr:hypothetical protein [Streptomyces decoyicus]
MMVRTESLARATSLGRPEVAYVARFTAADGAGEEFKVTWSDIARDTMWLQQRFTAWGMGRGKQVLLSTSGHEGAWFLPVINALKAIGCTYAIAEAMAWDWRRSLVFHEELELYAMLGLSGEIVAEQTKCRKAAELFGDVPVLLARPAAVRQLAAGGVAAGVLTPMGPALAVQCPESPGAHIDSVRWWVAERRGRIHLSARAGGGGRGAAETGLGIEGVVLGGRCGCGSDDPRVLLS